jgi:hypothetical protein
MERRFSAGEMLLGVLALALMGFVASQVVAAAPRRGLSSDSPARLSGDDSLSIATQYRTQLSNRKSGYSVPAWLAEVHIARLQSAAARDVAAGTTTASFTADAVNAVLDHGASPSYLKPMLIEDGNLVMRWKSGDAPIRVWVQPNSSEPGFTSGLIAPTRRGFTAWNELALGVQFSMVEDSTVADVHVTWSASMPLARQIGTTFRMTGGGGWIAIAHVILSTSYDIYAVQNAARHEAGHVLGLGHSPDPRDIMTATSEGRQYQITEADRHTVTQLYQLPAGALPSSVR